MTDNTLRVKITAQDRAAKVIEDLENRIKRLRAPTMQAAGAMGHVNETTTRLERFAKGRTLPLASEHLRRISRDAFGAFRNIGRLSAEMGGLGEVLAGGTVLGGLAAAAILTKRWADQGMRLRNMSANIGITPGELFRMERVGALHNVAAGTVSGGLQSIGLAEFDAKYNHDAKALTAYRELGIHVGTGNGHLASPVKILEQVADKIKGFTPQGQIRAVESIGLSPDILPLLRMGGKGIELAAAKLKAQGMTTASFAGSTKLYEDFWKLDNAAIELTNTFAKRMAGPLDDSIRELTRFAGWVGTANSAFDLNAINEGAAGAGKWLHNYVTHGFDAMTAPAAARRSQAMQYFEKKGYTKNQAAGIVANIQAESSYNPNATNRGHYGIAQWDASRRAQILAGTGIDVAHSTYSQQLKAVQWELTHTQKIARADLLSAPDAQRAALAIRNQYERPGITPSGGLRRMEMAKMIAADTFPEPSPRTLDAATPTPGAPRTLDPSVLSELSSLRAQKGNVTVDINHTNAPPGTTTRATASGAAAMGGLRISTAMPNQAYP